MAGELDGADKHRHRDLKLTWSGLLRWEECRRKEALYREGKRQAISDGRVFLPGTIADLTMRKWLEHPDAREKGSLAAFVQEVAQETTDNPERPVKWRNGSKNADLSSIIADVQEGMARLEPWLWENVLPYKFQPEARGVGTVGIPDANGDVQRVDLFVAVDIATYHDGQFSLHDLKFTRNDAYVRGKTLGQLTFYKIGWAAMMGIPLRDVGKLSFVTPMATELEIPVYPNEDDVRTMMSRITGYAQGIWAGDFPTKPEKDSDCTYRCDVRNSCPFFMQAQRNNGKVSFLESALMRKSG